jgi:hypothetical protein
VRAFRMVSANVLMVPLNADSGRPRRGRGAPINYFDGDQGVPDSRVPSATQKLPVPA